MREYKCVLMIIWFIMSFLAGYFFAEAIFELCERYLWRKKKEAKYIDSPEAIRFNNEQYLKTEGYNQALEDIANLFEGEK